MSKTQKTTNAVLGNQYGYDPRTFDRRSRYGASVKVGEQAYIHEMRPGSVVAIGELDDRSIDQMEKVRLLEVWPGSVLISRSKRATVPGRV